VVAVIVVLVILACIVAVIALMYVFYFKPKQRREEQKIARQLFNGAEKQGKITPNTVTRLFKE